MKRIIGLFTLLFLLSPQGMDLKAQAAEMLWGPEIKLKGTISFIGDHDGHLYTLRYFKKDVFLEKYEVQNMENVFSVPLDLSVHGGKQRMSVLSTYILDGNLVILGNYYDKNADRNYLKAIIHNESGELVEDWKELASFFSKSKRNQGGFGTRFSPDGKNLLILANMPFDDDDNEKYQLYLFDKTLNLKWEKEFVLSYTDGQTSIYDYVIDNNGTAHILANVAPATRKERKQAKKAKQDTDKQLLVSYDGTNEKLNEFELQLQNKTILTAALRLDTANNVILAGFYHDNLNKRAGLTGIFYSRTLNGQKEPELVTTDEFEKDFVERLIGEKRAKKGAEISTTYRLRKLIPTKDGGLVAIAEEYYVQENCTTDPKTGVRRCTYTYHYNSIIVTGINNEGRIVWNNLIKKRSLDGNFGYYLSFGTFVGEDKIYLVFNDAKKNYNEYGDRLPENEVRGVNLKKGVAALATISMDGNIEYSVLYDNKESKVYMRPKIAQQVNNELLIVLGHTKKRKTRLGRINF